MRAFAEIKFFEWALHTVRAKERAGARWRSWRNEMSLAPAPRAPGVSGNGGTDPQEAQSFCFSCAYSALREERVSRSREPQPSSHRKALPFRPHFQPTVPLHLPTPAPSSRAPTLASRGTRSARALLSACPAFHVSLPSHFLLSASSTATIGQPTSPPQPINAALSPPCYWVEQNKNRARAARGAPRHRHGLRSGFGSAYQ